MPDNQSEVRTYQISPRRRAVLYGCWGIMAVPLVIGGLASQEPALTTAGVLVSAIMLPLFWIVLRVARLTLTSEGLEVRQVGASMKTSWTNVAGVRLDRGSEGFVLREPLSSPGAARMADAANVVVRGAPLYDDERRRLLTEQRFIPIEAFAYWLHRGDLRDAVAGFAPHVFSPAASAEVAALTGHRSPQKLSTGRLMLIVSVIGVAMAAGVAIAMQPALEQSIAVQALEAIVGVALGVIAIGNVMSAVHRVRARRYASGLLWAIVAGLQILIVLAMLGHFLAPIP
jgi:hypothetical protein